MEYLLVPEVVGPGHPQSPPLLLLVSRRQERALRSSESRGAPLVVRSGGAGLAVSASPVIGGLGVFDGVLTGRCFLRDSLQSRILIDKTDNLSYQTG